MTMDSSSRKLLTVVLLIVALGIAIFAITSTLLLTSSAHRHSTPHVRATP